MNPLYTLVAKIMGAALLVLALVVGCWYAVDTIASAFRERTELRAEKIDLTNKVAAAEKARNEDVAAANKNAADLRSEIDKRSKLADEAAKRADQTTKELTNAQASISRWRAQADANLRACLDTRLPDGLFTDQAEAGTASPGK